MKLEVTPAVTETIVVEQEPETVTLTLSKKEARMLRYLVGNIGNNRACVRRLAALDIHDSAIPGVACLATDIRCALNSSGYTDSCLFPFREETNS